MSAVRLDKFVKRTDVRGRGRLVELAWLTAQALFVSSWQPSSWLRVRVMSLFGAQIGEGVVVKPGVQVKFPWKLKIGDHSWIGERVWIDNLAQVTVGAHCCLSQGAYLCTGNHDWSSPEFDLIVKPIVLGDGAWLGAHSRVSPGVVVGEEAVLSMGSVATGDLAPSMIYAGNPAEVIKPRDIKISQ